MQKQSAKPRTLEISTDYQPALLRLMGELDQVRASKAIAEFKRRLGDLIQPEHRELNKSGNVKWENYVRWARQALVNAGLMGSGGHGVWTITKAGRKWLQDHPYGDKRELVALIRRSSTAGRDTSTSSQRTQQLTKKKQSIKISGETFALSQADVLTRVRKTLADGLPPEAKRFTRWCLVVDGELLSIKWVISLATGLPTDRFTSYQARNQLRKLGLEAQLADEVKAAARPTGDAEPQPTELTREAFYRAVLARLADKLPPSVYNRRLNPRVNYLQLACPAPGTHYELRLLKSYTEIAIHFEGSRERNLSLLDQFSQVEALQEQLGETVYAEPWGKNWARIYLKRQPARLDAPTAEVLAGDWLRFIEITLPVVEKAVATLGLRVGRGRPSADVKEKDLNRPQAILAQEIRNIRAYLNGDGALSPSDEKLCDWVQFCYTFELFAEGAALFKLVRPDAVHPWLYERARKLARACELRNKVSENVYLA